MLDAEIRMRGGPVEFVEAERVKLGQNVDIK